MLAKGNRSRQVTNACKQHGGFYLGSIGGPAARLAQDCIKKVECLEYPELGMEAIWRIEVEDFPAFIVVDEGQRFLREYLNTTDVGALGSDRTRPENAFLWIGSQHNFGPAKSLLRRTRKPVLVNSPANMHDTATI